MSNDYIMSFFERWWGRLTFFFLGWVVSLIFRNKGGENGEKSSIQRALEKKLKKKLKEGRFLANASLEAIDGLAGNSPDEDILRKDLNKFIKSTDRILKEEV